MTDTRCADILHGYAEIGTYLRMSRRQAKYLAEARVLPTFTLAGRVVHARRSTLDAWLAEREAAARAPAKEAARG